MRRFRTHYDNLKVSRDAPPEVIRSAYRALVNKYHPDRNLGSERAVKAMQAINASFEVLDDPVKRRSHDQWIDQQLGQETDFGAAQQQAAPPRQQHRPSQREQTPTYAPPPNPTLQKQTGCFYWFVGLIAIGIVVGTFNECSGKKSPPVSPSASPPLPLANPEPTPLPSPPKPIEAIKPPFGMKWGETRERVRQFITQTGARVVSEGTLDYQRMLVAEGIEARGLESATFSFVNDSLREVSLMFGKGAWNQSPSNAFQKWVAEANDRYGLGYRVATYDTESAGIKWHAERWAWVQDTSAFWISFVSTKVDDKDFPSIFVSYGSTEFPPHNTVTFSTTKRALVPFQVITKAGSDYLIKLVNPQTRKTVVRMYVVGGETADFKVPFGDYEVLCASGVTWYGDELLFGPKTAYSKLDTVSRFALNADAQTQERLADLERKLVSETKALRDYMVRNKFPEKTVNYIFEGRDPQDNVRGPGRLATDWWVKNVLNKIGDRPKLHNGLVDRLNALGRVESSYYKLVSDLGGTYGVSLTLFPVEHGNIETLPITAEDFAGAGAEIMP